jgi:hypothetical protein
MLDPNEIKDANFISDSEIETRFVEKALMLSGYNLKISLRTGLFRWILICMCSMTAPTRKSASKLITSTS